MPTLNNYAIFLRNVRHNYTGRYSLRQRQHTHTLSLSRSLSLSLSLSHTHTLSLCLSRFYFFSSLIINYVQEEKETALSFNRELCGKYKEDILTNQESRKSEGRQQKIRRLNQLTLQEVELDKALLAGWAYLYDLICSRIATAIRLLLLLLLLLLLSRYIFIASSLLLLPITMAITHNHIHQCMNYYVQFVMKSFKSIILSFL